MEPQQSDEHATLAPVRGAGEPRTEPLAESTLRTDPAEASQPETVEKVATKPLDSPSQHGAPVGFIVTGFLVLIVLSALAYYAYSQQ